MTDTHVGFLSPNERVDPDERERGREGERSDQSELRRRLRGREEGAAQGDIGWEIEGDIGSCSCC